MAAETMECTTIGGAAASFQVRSGWQAIHGQIDSIMDVILDSSDPSPESSTSIVEAGDLDLSLAPPSINPGPCEITVEFQHRLCHVHSICVLGSSRLCEIYSQAQSSGDFDYICTARGTLEEGCSSGETGQLYEAEIELVNADAWAAVKIRLLSLENPARADVRKITVRGNSGAPPTSAAREDEQGSFSSNSSNSSSLLTMLMPSVLQIVRGMSDGMESRRAQMPKKIEAGPSKEVEVTRQHAETSFRLQRLEMAIGRMEVFLQGAFSKLDDRMSSIEGQISTLQQQQQQHQESPDVSVSKMSQPAPASDATSDVLAEEADHPIAGEELTGHRERDKDGDGYDDEDEENEEEGEGEDDEDDEDEEEDDNNESSPSVSGGSGESSSGSLETDSTSARRGSLSLENAWASALAAFSVSVVPVTPAPEEKFEDAEAEVSAERPADSNGDVGDKEVLTRNRESEPGDNNDISSGGGGEFVELEAPEAAAAQEHHRTAEAAEVSIEQQGKESGSSRSDGDDPARIGFTGPVESAGSREVDLIDFDEAVQQEPRKSNCSSAESPPGASPDSLLIDCIDGVYLMQQKKVEISPDKGGGGGGEVVEDGFDLIASPSKVDPETDLICTDLMF